MLCLMFALLFYILGSLHRQVSGYVRVVPAKVSANSGENVTFTCITPGNLSTMYFTLMVWSLRTSRGSVLTLATNGKLHPSVPSHHHYVSGQKLDKSTRPVSLISEFTIVNFQASDVGNYKCEKKEHKKLIGSAEGKLYHSVSELQLAVGTTVADLEKPKRCIVLSLNESLNVTCEAHVKKTQAVLKLCRNHECITSKWIARGDKPNLVAGLEYFRAVLSTESTMLSMNTVGEKIIKCKMDIEDELVKVDVSILVLPTPANIKCDIVPAVLDQNVWVVCIIVSCQPIMQFMWMDDKQTKLLPPAYNTTVNKVKDSFDAKWNLTLEIVASEHDFKRIIFLEIKTEDKNVHKQPVKLYNLQKSTGYCISLLSIYIFIILFVMLDL